MGVQNLDADQWRLLIVGLMALVAVVGYIVRSATGRTKKTPVNILGYTSGPIVQDEVLYRRVVEAIPTVDRTIPRLRTPLAAGMGEQWEAAKADLKPFSEKRALSLGTSRAMSTVHRLDRIAHAVTTLEAAENGAEDARLAIVDDLLEDLMFAAHTVFPASDIEAAIRAGIFAVTDQVRVLKGDLTSEKFFAEFFAACAQYASVMRGARPIFKHMKKEESFSPPAVGEQFWIFGAGIDGLVPWMQCYAINERLEFLKRA